MNGELTKNTFGPAKPHTPDSTDAFFGDTVFPNAQTAPGGPDNDPMQLSLFGEAVRSGEAILSGEDGETGGNGGELLPLLSGDADIGAAEDAAPPQHKRRKKSAAILTAFLCVSSVASYICAGLFVADRVMGKIPAFFANELMASADGIAEIPGDTAIVIPAVKPSESEPADADVPAGIPEYPVEGVSMATHDPFAVANETKYTPDIAALTSVEAFAGAKPAAAAAAGEPLVLVVHTHATESFLADGVTSYNDDTTFRSTDPAQNMIAVGEELCRALGDAGIEALHCTEMFDKESFIHSYEKSAAAVGEYLKSHPSIQYVLDVHRDAIFRQDSTLLAARSADGSAQVMLVCGTDEMGADFPDWQNNLAFAFSLQSAAKSLYPDLMRNVNLRGASFNEQLAERFLLVEVGSAGNTLAEAKEAARRFAEVFASVVNG